MQVHGGVAAFRGKALSATKLKRCPICRQPTDPAWKVYPFCSDRCKTIDLGNWSSERYRAHSPLTEADEKNDPADRTPQDEIVQDD
jgi:endogenous inhibitor of DNA gyrase (YacG/DUF329 family)